MALTTSTIVGLAAAAAAAGAQTYNTNRTLSRQDAQAAAGIQRSSRIQQRADQRVGEEVENLKASTADKARKQRTAEFATALRNARSKTEEGLGGLGLGEDFANAAAAAKGDIAARGATEGQLLAGIEAPGLQRQAEAFNYGNLATDVAGFQREASGDQFVTDLLTRSVRRNPWIDAGASVLSGVSSGMAGAGGAAGSAAAGLKPLNNTGPNTKAGGSAKLWGSLGQPSRDELLQSMRYGMGGA